MTATTTSGISRDDVLAGLLTAVETLGQLEQLFGVIMDRTSDDSLAKLASLGNYVARDIGGFVDHVHGQLEDGGFAQ